MARVTIPGGQVAACVWDHAGGGGPLSLFWQAATDIDPLAQDESRLPGARQGHLSALWEAAGLKQIQSTMLTVRVRFGRFDDWWEPFTLGVGPAGAYLAQLEDAQRDVVRTRCAELLPTAPFELTASAWCEAARA